MIENNKLNFDIDNLGGLLYNFRSYLIIFLIIKSYNKKNDEKKS